MEFLVKLIKVDETKNGEARKDLQSNCTHIGNDYWLFEGDEFALDEGIKFSVVDEKAIECYGDLSSGDLRRMVRETYEVGGVGKSTALFTLTFGGFLD